MRIVTDENRRLDWLIARTLLILQDPNGEKYAQARIIEALNFACLEIAITTELIKDEIDIQVLAAQAAYDVAAAITTDGTVHPLAYPVRIGYSGTTAPGLLPISTMVLDAVNLGTSVTSNPLAWRLDLLSYGEIQIDPVPQDDGEALPDETGNLQVAYVGMPTPMATPATDYPDPLIPGYYHELLPFFAARFILDEGDVEDMALGDRYGERWRQGTNEVKSDSYNLTSYSDTRPM